MPNPIWQPTVPVLSNRVLELNRGNTCVYVYTLPGIVSFPDGTTGTLSLYNQSGQSLGIWAGTVSGNTITFTQPASVANLVPAGTSWTLTALYPDSTNPTMLAQGTVVRNEAPFPSLPPTSTTQTVNYSYTFSTTGSLGDPAFNILSGVPVVYDNSSLSLPNACAAGSPEAAILNDDITEITSDGPWAQAAMLYYAPLGSDNVNLTYQAVQGNGVLGGITYVVICSAYDMSTCAAFWHQQWASGFTNEVGIAVGSGPTTFTTKATADYTTTSLDTFTASYNAASNTYALYVGTNPTPLVTWVDGANAVPHGPGFRYVGFSFQSAFLAPGVEIANWYISDAVPLISN